MASQLLKGNGTLTEEMSTTTLNYRQEDLELALVELRRRETTTHTLQAR